MIPMAEESGQIHELGVWVFREVCQQVKKWTELSQFTNLIVSINVSANQLKLGNLNQIVKSILDEYDINPAFLELEFTETAIMSDPEMAQKELDAIHQLGLKISVDDFGTGLSSLNCLTRFPIQTLKIDSSFISNIGTDSHDETIIRIIVAIAKTWGISVIAEGVETDRQLAFLSSIGCDLMQGHIFSKPVEASEATKNIIDTHQYYESCFARFQTFLKSNFRPATGKRMH